MSPNKTKHGVYEYIYILYNIWWAIYNNYVYSATEVDDGEWSNFKSKVQKYLSF